MNLARFRNAGLFLTLALLWGFTFVGAKTGLPTIPPVFFAALRFDVALPFLVAYVLWQYDDPRPRSRADYTSMGIGAVTVVAANNGFLFLGQDLITPAAAAVMYGLNPMLSPLFAFLLLDERLDRVGLAGIALGLVGVVIIVQPSPDTLLAGSTVGRVLVLMAAVSVALGSVLMDRVGSTMDSVPLTVWAMGLGALLLHCLSVGVGETVDVGAVTPTIVLAVLVVGILATAMAYPLYFVLIDEIGPVRTNLVAYFVTVAAAIVGWLLFGDVVSPFTVLGFLVVVTGVAMLEREVVSEEIGRVYRLVAGR